METSEKGTSSSLVIEIILPLVNGQEIILTEKENGPVLLQLFHAASFCNKQRFW